MLGYKGLQNLRLDRRRLRAVGITTEDRSRLLHMHREKGPVSQVPATTHHRQINASLPALHPDRQYVYIAVGYIVNRLLVQNIRQGAHLVAQLRRLFEFKLFSVRHHAQLEQREHLSGVALQEALGVGDVVGVILG